MFVNLDAALGNHNQRGMHHSSRTLTSYIQYSRIIRPVRSRFITSGVQHLVEASSFSDRRTDRLGHDLILE